MYDPFEEDHVMICKQDDSSTEKICLEWTSQTSTSISQSNSTPEDRYVL